MDRLKKVETVKEELERQLVVFESFKKYCEELKDKGTSCEIAQVAEDVHIRATELHESTVCQSECTAMDIRFIASDFEDLLKVKTTNLIGKIVHKVNVKKITGLIVELFLFRCKFYRKN